MFFFLFVCFKPTISSLAAAESFIAADVEGTKIAILFTIKFQFFIVNTFGEIFLRSHKKNPQIPTNYKQNDSH